MKLPEDFLFSQRSFQDYLDCKRRFQLRYLVELEWPSLIADETQDLERALMRGQALHRLIQQHQSGIPADSLEGQIGDEELLRLWKGYRSHPVPNLPAVRYPELRLVTHVHGFRLLVKVDLLAAAPGEQFVIVDWKSGRPLPFSKLRDRAQTKVYLYALATAGYPFNQGKPVDPESMEMVYWFAEQPDQPVRIPYSAERLEKDRRDLEGWVEDILQRDVDEFPLTSHEERCSYCPYRSKCDRGDSPGSMLSKHWVNFDLDSWDLDMDEIEELPFA